MAQTHAPASWATPNPLEGNGTPQVKETEYPTNPLSFTKAVSPKIHPHLRLELHRSPVILTSTGLSLSTEK